MCFDGFHLIKEMTCSVNSLNSYCPWSWGILKFGEVQPMCNKCMCVKKMVHPSSMCSCALAVYCASCTPSSPATLMCPSPWTRVASCLPPRHATPRHDNTDGHRSVKDWHSNSYWYWHPSSRALIAWALWPYLLDARGMMVCPGWRLT